MDYPEFKLIIAGSRQFNDYRIFSEVVINHIQKYFEHNMLSIVSGLAKGPDYFGTVFAKEYDIKLYEFPADWSKYGKSAGYIRNAQMGDFSDGLLAFWNNTSKGTYNMIEYMHKLGKPVYIHYF